jgi:hypothetical protein
MVVHVLMPLAPPRMMSRLGFLDTMAVFGPSAYGESTTNIANQFAAMPSLHVGWALLIAVVVIRTAATPWRWATLAHPFITVVVVVATANHYWMDAIAAAVLLAVALAVTPMPNGPAPVGRLWRRWRAGRATTAAGAAAAGATRPSDSGVRGEAGESAGARRLRECVGAGAGAVRTPPRPRAPLDEDTPLRGNGSR